jgi:DNA-binding XRE family transcriptional regulator
MQRCLKFLLHNIVEGRRMANIRKLRTMADLTQASLAQKTGVERTKLSLAENRYIDLRPEEEAEVIKVLLEHIEHRIVTLRRVLGRARLRLA